jgi:hypothetical protein
MNVMSVFVASRPLDCALTFKESVPPTAPEGFQRHHGETSLSQQETVGNVSDEKHVPNRTSRQALSPALYEPMLAG